jgi:hypothetical protein
MDLKDVICHLVLQVVQDICRSKFIGFPLPKKQTKKIHLSQGNKGGYLHCMLPCLIGFHDFIFLIGGKHD